MPTGVEAIPAVPMVIASTPILIAVVVGRPVMQANGPVAGYLNLAARNVDPPAILEDAFLLAVRDRT
jgi:hypothetical protein